MNSETKQFIETHIDLIKNNSIASTYVDCPLRILNDFNNTLHIAGIYYPPDIHVYVVLCCYMSNRFTNVYLHSYDSDYKTEKEEYEFVCDNCVYLVEELNHDLSILLPKRSINADIVQQPDFRGITRLNIRVKVN